jgi:hypothetical protein
MKRSGFLLAVFVIFVCQGWCATPAFGHEPGLTVAIHKVQRSLRIDGRLDDPGWRTAARIELAWTAAEKGVSDSIRTQVMAIYDEKALYVAFLNREPDTANLLATVSEHDKAVPGDDSVGILLETGNSGKGALFAIYVSSANVTYDTWTPSGELMEKRRNGEIPVELVPIAMAYPKGPDWDPKGLKTATHIEKGSWTLEIRIPFEDLLQSGVPEGKTWGVNFVRHVPGWEDVWATWSKAGRSFNKPDRFGDLIFSE